MTLIAQVSDLHFGSEEPATTQALVDELNRERLDLVILSGDLTLAARSDEFARARRFIDALDAPTLAVPGNHDLTPYKIVERLVRPWARWKRHVATDLEPSWFGEGVAVIGLNTARRMRLKLDWSHGSISRLQIGSLRRRFARARTDDFRIVVAHHPFIDEAGVDLSDRPSAIVKRADRALAAFVEQRVDLVTCGHLHRTYFAGFGGDAPAKGLEHGAEPAADETAGAVVAEAGEPRHRVTVIQAGTALSHRTRGEPNSFNRIEISAGRLAVHKVTWFDTRWEREPEPLVEIDRPSATK